MSVEKLQEALASAERLIIDFGHRGNDDAADTISALATEIKRLHLLADSATADSFLLCDDATKKIAFALMIDESSRRKRAEQRVDELENEVGRLRNVLAERTAHWRDAYAAEALAAKPAQGAHSTFANSENSVETHAGSRQPAQGEEWRRVIVDVMADISDHGSLAYEKLRALLQAAPPSPSVPDEVAKDAARYQFIRRKICFTGNGDGTCSMHAINLPEACVGWPEIGQQEQFVDVSIDAAMLDAAPEVKQ